jgi:16S rRNA (guanine527-N7)-methyltransferase
VGATFSNLENFDRQIAGAGQLGVTISREQSSQFARYAELLEEWNEKLNLTRVAPEDYVTLHFFDSLSLTTAFRYSGIQVFEPDNPKSKLKNPKLLDVGTGAGLPGVPLKIAFPDLDVTLMDSTKKRLDFLDVVISDLGLAGIRTLHARAEEAGREAAHREKYDIVVARAVSAMNVLAEWMLPLVKVGGFAVAMKSAGAEGEIEAAKRAISAVGGKLEAVERVTLPDTEIERLLVVLRKERPTEFQYPRPGTVIKQRPL